MKTLLVAIIIMASTGTIESKAKELVGYARKNHAAEEVLGTLKTTFEIARKVNPLAFYTPIGKLESVINAVGEKQHKWIFVLAAANKIGKTAGTMNILGNIIWGPQNEWFQGKSRFDNWPHPKRFWYLSEHETLKNVVVGTDGINGELIKWFPHDQYRLTKESRDFFSAFTAKNGWTGKFMTYDQDIKQFESDNIGILILDEPPPEAIYNAGLARMLVGGGLVILPMTPLNHSAWIFDRLINTATKDGPVFVLQADIEDACIEHGVRGFIPHQNIERIVDQYDEEERDARAHGKATHLSGLVYKNLHPDKHRHKELAHQFKQTEYDIYCVCDPHDARPPMLAWAAVDKLDKCRIIYEFPNTELGFAPFHQIKNWKLTTDQVCQRIKEIETLMGWDPGKIVRVMDPNFGRKHQAATGKTVQEQFMEGGRKIGWPMYFSTEVIDELDAGHRMVRDRMWINPDGETRFTVGECCTNIWSDLCRYSYDFRRGRALDRHGAGERVEMKYKDGADLIRYLLMFVYGPHTEEIGPPQYNDFGEYINQVVEAEIMIRASHRRGIS